MLPFKNLMQKQDANYLSEGIAATITAKLGGMRGISVVGDQLEAAFKEMGLQAGSIG